MQRTAKMKNTVNVLSFFAASLIALHLTGCASIVDGNSKKLSIKTDPEGAKVTVYDLKRPVYDKITPKVAVMHTPCVIPLRTGSRHQSARYFVTLEKEGHQTLGFEVHATVNGWYFGNLADPILLALFPISMGLVDPMTGAMWTIEPQTPEHLYEIQDLSKIPDENVDAPIIRMPAYAW